ncbi:MAG: hypothetical protein AAGA72_18630 [Pseudomonadota bacterium]
MTRVQAIIRKETARSRIVALIVSDFSEVGASDQLIPDSTATLFDLTEHLERTQ